MKSKIARVQLPLALGQKQEHNVSNVTQTGLTMFRVHKIGIMRFKRKQRSLSLSLGPCNGFSK